MTRRRRHEEHQNQEAWAIPYGDLMTLLLAFFVVMYAISSVNEGKYRQVSESLSAAFRGEPKTIDPLPIGRTQLVAAQSGEQPHAQGVLPEPAAPPDPLADAANNELADVASQVETAMQELIAKDLVVVRRHQHWVEVEIRTDILFGSGAAKLSDTSLQVLGQLADTLKPFPNGIRVEGHTDNQPIRNTSQFRSNWELSAARAASVVHLFADHGVAQSRLSVIGLGEFRPSQPNTSPAGRNANRRVVLVILGGDGLPEGDYAEERGKETLPAAPAAPPAASN